MNKLHIAATIAASLLVEGMDDTGCAKLNKFQAMALDLGGENFFASEGVAYVEIKGCGPAQQFMDALDDEDCVEAYDVAIDGDESGEEIDDLSGYGDDTVFGFTFYLEGDSVTYEACEVDQAEFEEAEKADCKPVLVDDEGTELDEVRKRIMINHKGVKKLKMQCPKGFKYSAAEHSCVKIAGDELATKRKASIRAVMSRKAGGASLKARAAVRTKKALAFRKAAGL